MNRPIHLIVSGALLVIAIIIVIILARGLNVDSSKPQSMVIGKPAPPLKVQWFDGYAPSIPLNQQTKPTVINFWASWCLSCRQEAHLLQKLWQDHRQQLNVVGIAVHDTRDNALAFAGRFNKSYFLALDRDGAIAIDFGVTGVPETFIVDGRGIVQFRQVGAVTSDFLRQVEPLL